jgi:hypothetical protein
VQHRSWFLALLRPWSACLLAAGAVVVAATPALAAWPTDPAVNLPVCTEVFDQEFPAVLPDGAGGVFVAWQDFRNEGDYDVFAQRISASGVPQWGTNGIPVCNMSGDQLVPHLASDGAGGVIVTWNDTRALLSDIYAQRLSPNGDLLWNAQGVPLCTAAGPQHDESVTPDGAGGAYVAWWDRRANGGTAVPGDIYAQRVNANGVPLWTPDGVPICVAGDNQEYPVIVATDIGALIAWADQRNGTGNRDIYARAITSAGVPMGPADGIAVCNAVGDETSTVMVTDGANGAIVAWTDPRSGAPEKTYAQRLSDTCAPLWAANGVAVTSAPPSGELFPAMVADGAGGAILTWSDFRNAGTTGADVFAQRLSPAGTRLWTAAGVLLCNAAAFQFYPTIATDGASGAIVTWQDQRNGSANNDVYARHVTAAGVAQWGDPSGGLPVSTAPGTQYFPQIASDGSGGAIATWMDIRDTTTDVYAQRIKSDGTLGGGTVDVSSGRPQSIDLAIAGPNPSPGDRLQVRFTLAAGTSGTLELLDVAGRRVAAQDLAGLGPGGHTLALHAAAPLPAGLYLVRLREGGSERVTRVAVLK